jgi:hypothetical protein
MKTAHLRNFNSLALHKFGKDKTTNKTFLKSFSLLSGFMDVPHTTHLVLTGKSGVLGLF